MVQRRRSKLTQSCAVAVAHKLASTTPTHQTCHTTQRCGHHSPNCAHRHRRLGCAATAPSPTDPRLPCSAVACRHPAYTCVTHREARIGDAHVAITGPCMHKPPTNQAQKRMWPLKQQCCSSAPCTASSHRVAAVHIRAVVQQKRSNSQVATEAGSMQRGLTTDPILYTWMSGQGNNTTQSEPTP